MANGGKKRSESSDVQPPGPGVDAQGRTVDDPTANVKALNDAATRRQDDLREMDSAHVRELMLLREKYEDKLREAESKRIDAIRAVDVGAVNRAAEVSAAQAQTLATQVSVSAETLRTQVQAAAAAATTSLAAALEPIQKDIADLRRVQYEQAGASVSVKETKSDTKDNSARNMAILAAVMTGLFFIVAIASFALSLKK